jgi:transcriptional regulator with PAS, ATPase and Fis domain
MVDQGAFREDLYYRINLIEIKLPSLRERQSDIPLLTKHFLQKVKALYDIEVPYIDDETLEWLSLQEFPGNIRQLKNLVERTALLHYHEKVLTPKAFQSVMSLHQSGSSKVSLPNVGVLTLDEMERKMIIKALNYHGNSISKTARSLGITRSSLYRRIEKYEISLV